MRENRPTIFAKLAAATAFCSFLGIIAAARVAAAEGDLPPKAREVAAKFETYKKTATPAAIEAKRKQVVDYLGGLLKKEASAANLEGALAVKALMDQISGKTPASLAEPRVSSPTIGKEVTPAAKSQRPRKKLSTGSTAQATRFSITSEATRELAFEFDVIAAAAGASSKTIRCEIGGASDDSGDKGLHYELIDPSGKLAKRGFLRSFDTEIVTHETTKPGTWNLLIKDEDTSLDGAHPGNSGSVKVKVLPGSPRGARDTALASGSRG